MDSAAPLGRSDDLVFELFEQTVREAIHPNMERWMS